MIEINLKNDSPDGNNNDKISNEKKTIFEIGKDISILENDKELNKSLDRNKFEKLLDDDIERLKKRIDEFITFTDDKLGPDEKIKVSKDGKKIKIKTIRYQKGFDTPQLILTKIRSDFETIKNEFKIILNNYIKNYGMDTESEKFKKRIEDEFGKIEESLDELKEKEN